MNISRTRTGSDFGIADSLEQPLFYGYTSLAIKSNSGADRRRRAAAWARAHFPNRCNESDDPLTRLPLRAAVHAQLASVVRPQPGTDSPLVAALVVDLDDFKSINDVHGYSAGDAVLVAVADRLSTLIQPGDVIGRNGGDEFLIILESPERPIDAQALAENIRQSLSEPFEIGDDLLHLTASLGVAVHPRASVTSDQLLNHADIALLSAKQGGRDRAVFFDTKQAEEGKRLWAQTELVRSSLDALDENRLTMRYQPVVDEAGVTVGVESLARCVTRTGEVKAPKDFYEGAVRGNLVVRLDRQAFRQSCAAARQLAQQLPSSELYVACNFSPKSLAQVDFAERILAEIGSAGVDPHRICVEITETAAFEAGPRSVTALNTLAQAGVRIALDDFGTGFSSLSHLLDLPLREVKIDRSFVARLHERSTHWTITKAAVELAAALGLDVVAEGVENQLQVDEVQRLGIGYMQGWYFSPGLRLDQLIDYLHRVTHARCDPRAQP